MTRVGGGALVRRVLVGLLWLGGLVGVLGEIEEFSTSRDSRELYLIKSFGFNRGGFAALEVRARECVHACVVSGLFMIIFPPPFSMKR